MIRNCGEPVIVALDAARRLCFDGGWKTLVVRRVGILTRQSISEFESDNRPESWAARLSDIMIFVGVLLLSALAIAAVAVAAPIILAVSVIAGLMFKNAPTTSWRQARA